MHAFGMVAHEACAPSLRTKLCSLRLKSFSMVRLIERWECAFLSPSLIVLYTCESHTIRMLDCHVARNPALMTAIKKLDVHYIVKK
jgi:hypothetical protein